MLRVQKILMKFIMASFLWQNAFVTVVVALQKHFAYD